MTLFYNWKGEIPAKKYKLQKFHCLSNNSRNTDFKSFVVIYTY